MLNPEGKDFNIGGFRQAVLLATVTKSKIPSTQEEAPQSAGGAAGCVSEGDVWHPISDEEHITYQQSFERFDTDRDGKLSAGDVKQDSSWPKVQRGPHQSSRLLVSSAISRC